MGTQPAGIAIVTGAASGMGEAAARLMHEAGWPLLLCDLHEQRLAEAAQSLGAGEDIETLADDIAGVLTYERLLVGALTMAKRFRELPAGNGRLLRFSDGTLDTRPSLVGAK